MVNYLHYLDYLVDIFDKYNSQITIGLTVLVLILVISNILSRTKLIVMTKNYKKLMQLLKVKESDSLNETLIQYIEKVNALENKVGTIEVRFDDIVEKVNNSIQRVEIIRYNAFDYMGSDLSFSIALLDENLDGFIITNIYAREESNIYAKPIERGKSRYALSVEEIQVLDRAKKGATVEQ